MRGWAAGSTERCMRGTWKLQRRGGIKSWDGLHCPKSQLHIWEVAAGNTDPGAVSHRCL